VTQVGKLRDITISNNKQVAVVLILQLQVNSDAKNMDKTASVSISVIPLAQLKL
jgi:hypothetical protein